MPARDRGYEPGAVFLTEEDFEAIRIHLNIEAIKLLSTYCRGLEKAEGLVVALKEKANFDCIFWDKGCTIYSVRPLQCRTFPYWPFLVESFSDWENEKYRCKGIGQKGSQTLEDKFEMYMKEKNVVYMKMP